MVGHSLFLLFGMVKRLPRVKWYCMVSHGPRQWPITTYMHKCICNAYPYQPYITQFKQPKRLLGFLNPNSKFWGEKSQLA